MANLMKMKRSSVPGKVPTTADLDLGEIAINTYDGKVYMKKNVSGVETIVLLTGAGAGDVLGPASSADNAIARFDGTSGKIVQNSSATIDDSGNLSVTSSTSTGTGANTMSVGTTAQRPATPTTGMYRMNSTLNTPEWYDASSSQWVPFANAAPLSAEYIVVAGGGGGENVRAGGGGAGGYRTGTLTGLTGSYAITVGAGGAGVPGGAANGATNGGNSSIGSLITSIGGGKSYSNGGSGGGAQGNAGATYGVGTSGQGNNGGQGAYYGAGGGGGANAAGGNGTQYVAGNGGAGKSDTWTGSTRYLGGGGGGGHQANLSGTAGTGGVGGGGNGGLANASSATASTGGGGGGAGGDGSSYFAGGAGGSGIVVIRYLGAQKALGGTITTSGGYTIHTFTNSDNFTVL